MIEIDEPNQLLLPHTKRYKSKSRIIAIALSSSLSAIMFGYSLKEITSVPIKTIEQNYNFVMDIQLLQGLLIGIMPFGGLFGSLTANYFTKKVTRRTGMNFMLPILILSIVLVQITKPLTLFLGRFFEGLSVGYYVSIAPIYLKQISPKQLRSLTGTFFSLGKIFGVLLVICLELILQNSWRLLLSVTAILALIQTILLFFIGTDTPIQWIQMGNTKKSKQAIKILYKDQYVDEIFQEYSNDHKTQVKKSQLSALKNTIEFQAKKKRALHVAISVCLIRHLSGGNSLITSAGIILSPFNQTVGYWTPLIINLAQFISLLLTITIFSKRIGKKKLLIFSSGILTILNGILIFSLIYFPQVLILINIIIFMIVYGGIMLPPSWSYPSEIISASQAIYPNIAHWLALAVSTLAPSLVMSIMEDNSVYPCFIFFFIYSLFTTLYFMKYLVESNGYNYEQIISNFKK